MRQLVYVKTAAGNSEIQARQLRLHPRTRSLLVLIDGKHNAAELLSTLAPLGISESTFAELAQHGLIAASHGTEVAASAPETLLADNSDVPTEIGATAQGDAPTGAHQQMRALYAFFNDHIREALGLRGFLMQLQVEKAESIADYHAIREQFLAAVRKSKGEMAAAGLQAKLDRLMAAPA
jgi:hypothetical protein